MSNDYIASGYPSMLCSDYKIHTTVLYNITITDSDTTLDRVESSDVTAPYVHSGATVTN